MLLKYFFLAILVVMPISTASSKQIFRHVDDNGNVSFSDKLITQTKDAPLKTTKIKILPQNSGDSQQNKELLFTSISGADIGYASKDNGILTIYSKKKRTLPSLLHVLKAYYEGDEKRIFKFDRANMFSVEINDFKNLSLLELLTDLENKNLIKFYITEGKIEVWRESNHPY